MLYNLNDLYTANKINKTTPKHTHQWVFLNDCFNSFISENQLSLHPLYKDRP